nr:MAG TPA: hypothetical protein [Caudoviricetes sp.]
MTTAGHLKCPAFSRSKNAIHIPPMLCRNHP